MPLLRWSIAHDLPSVEAFSKERLGAYLDEVRSIAFYVGGLNEVQIMDFQTGTLTASISRV